jgi:hypothetical protein
MSNALAIATVTATLQEVLTNALPASNVGGAQVTTYRPDNPLLNGSAITPGVNIFLYQVAPDTAWRNTDLPTRGPDGSLLRRPRAALDLFYLLSFYGDDTTLDQQRLLGAVAQALHAAPALNRAMVQTIEAKQPMFASGLSEQHDLVRFTPINFSLEELSKLWSVFLKTDYVLSLAYIASVVLIETDDPPPAGALPVLQPNIQAVPFSLAAIDSINPQAVQLAAAGPTVITLQGAGLSSDTSVAFMTPGETAAIAGVINSGSTSQSMAVTLPAGLRPGVNAVQLTQLAVAGSPPGSSPQIISQSNAAAFVILPALVDIGPTSPAGTLTAVVSPPVGPLQQVSLILNQLAGSPPANPQAFTLPATPTPQGAETQTFTFSTAFGGGSVPAGTYLARVRVDSAESRLTVDSSGAFNGPLVIVP